MIMTIAIAAFFIVVIMFIIDASRDQVITSQISTYLQPFAAETIVKHNYNAKPKMVWNAITKLSDYNFWFPGVLRVLPVVQTDRYVHKYSFEQFDCAPGAAIRIRPFSLSPAFLGQITSVEDQKQFALKMRFNPFHKETVVFNLAPSPEGTEVTCRRTSRGLFSWMTLWGFTTNKSKILDNLGYFIPEEVVEDDQNQSAEQASGPQYSREAIIARAVQAGLDGNMDLVHAIPDKPTRGMAKAMLVQSQRKGNVMPDHLVKALSEEPVEGSPAAPALTESSGGGLPSFSNPEDLIAFVVNKALDGDDEPINAITDKPTRGKAKAMMVKIKRGSVDRPAMPEVSAAPEAAPAVEAPTSSGEESEEDMIARLVDAGVNGNMDEINALDDRVIRGKIKAAIVKAKRAKG